MFNPGVHSYVDTSLFYPSLLYLPSYHCACTSTLQPSFAFQLFLCFNCTFPPLHHSPCTSITLPLNFGPPTNIFPLLPIILHFHFGLSITNIASLSLFCLQILLYVIILLLSSFFSFQLSFYLRILHPPPTLLPLHLN